MVRKRSIVVRNHKTSISLENEFWEGLKEIAVARQATVRDLVGMIDAERQHNNLSSAIRVFVLDQYRKRFTDGAGARPKPASPADPATPLRGGAAQ